MEIKIKDVYYNVDNKEVFRDLNINFKDNSITGIIGPVGSGKSILLELIANLRDIDDGEIEIGGITLTNKTTKRDSHRVQKEVGILFQSSYDQIYNLTVKKELL